MNSRTLVASLVVVLSAGSMLMPTDASARGGGMGFGRPGGFHGGFRPFAMRPIGPIRATPRSFPQVRPVPRPFVHPQIEPRHHIVRPRLDTIGPRRHRHGPDGYGFPLVAGVTVYSGWPSYQGDDTQAEPDIGRSYVVPVDNTSPLQAEAAVGGPAGGVLRHTCRSDAETVPSEHGGKTQVTVTRCYHMQ
jgi:hypothetical protein